MASFKIFKKDTVESTNDSLAELLKDEKQIHGSILVANHQLAGRGNGNTKWESQAGKNLTFSMVLYPRFIAPSQQFEVSKVVALGIKDYLLEKTTDVKIKWPNDIYIGDKKIAGILIENTIKGEIFERSIVGIGININQTKFISDAPNPVSLKQISGIDYDLEEELDLLAKRILHQFDHITMALFHNIMEEYTQHLYKYGEWHSFKANENKFEGMIKGVNEFGHLKVEEKDGSIKAYDLKEIEFVL